MNTPQKLPKTPKEERRRLLKGLMQSIGWGNINKTQLGRQWGVDRKQIEDDRDSLMKEVSNESLAAIQFQLDIDYQKARDELREIMSDKESSKATKIKACRTMLEANDKYTGFLESWNRKEKVAERVQIDEDPATRLYRKLFKEASDRGTTNKDIQRKGRIHK